MPHADSAHVPAASALPSAGLECVPRLSDRKAAPDRASVVRAASCPFAAQSGPVRVASFPRRQNAGWRHKVPGVTGVARSAEVETRPDARSPWLPFWGTWPRWIQNREEKKTHPPPQAFWPCGERDWPLLHRAYGGKGGSIFLFFVCQDWLSSQNLPHGSQLLSACWKKMSLAFQQALQGAKGNRRKSDITHAL